MQSLWRSRACSPRFGSKTPRFSHMSARGNWWYMKKNCRSITSFGSERWEYDYCTIWHWFDLSRISLFRSYDTHVFESGCPVVTSCFCLDRQATTWARSTGTLYCTQGYIEICCRNSDTFSTGYELYFTLGVPYYVFSSSWFWIWSYSSCWVNTWQATHGT